MLTVSEKAAEKIKSILDSEQKALTDWGLRLAVEGGGCSGLQYRMDITKKRDDDAVFGTNGVQVFVDPKSIQYVSGSQVDYVDALTGAGFKIRNPQEKTGCGCGQSFSV